ASVRLPRWSGANLPVLHVVPPAVPLGGEMIYVPTPHETRRARLADLRTFVADGGPEGVAVDVVCREGDPLREIREVARECAAGLIVMGTHGRSGFRNLMLGSVTESILRNAPVPVMTVRYDVA